jgi:autotransporter-associated beta strand protein
MDANNRETAWDGDWFQRLPDGAVFLVGNAVISDSCVFVSIRGSNGLFRLAMDGLRPPNAHSRSGGLRLFYKPLICFGIALDSPARRHYCMNLKFLVAVGAAVALTAVAPATVVFTWNGQGPSAAGEVGSNWVGGVAPDGTTGTESVVFGDVTPAQSAQVIAMPSTGIALNDVTFSSLTRPEYTLSGSGLPLAIFGDVFVGSGANVIFNSSLGIVLAGYGQQVSVGSATTLFVASVISESSAGAGITKTGLGTLQLSGANTYSGGTQLNGGTLAIASDSNLGSAYAALSFNGGTLRLTQALTLARSLYVDANGGTIDTNSLPLSLTGDSSGSGALLLNGGSAGSTVTLTGHAAHAETTVRSGVLQIGNNGTSGAHDGDIHLDNSGPLSPRVIFSRADAYTYAGVITGSASAGQAVTVAGSGTTTFTGHHQYTGATYVGGNGGTLALESGATLGSGNVTVGSGTLLFTNNASIGNVVTVTSGGTLAGQGSATTAFIQSGGTLAPGLIDGNQIGELAFGDLTLESGGAYEWHLQNPTGIAGQDWDVVTIGSPTTLTITATAASPFSLKVISLNAAGTPGAALGFADQTYVWTIFNTSATSVVGFDPAAFVIDASAFATNFPAGTFSVFQDSGTNNIMLGFTPVPEPSTYALLALGLGVVAWTLRRRRR